MERTGKFRKMRSWGLGLLLSPVAIWAVFFLAQFVLPKPEVAGFALESYLLTLAPLSVISGIALVLVSGLKNRKLQIEVPVEAP